MNKNEEKVLLICPLFADVGSEDLSAVSARQGARRMDVKKGQTVLQRGRTGPFVGVILSGALELVRTDFFGNRSIVAHMSPGELFGESFACAGVKAMPVSAVAVENGTCLLLDCRRITVSCTNVCAFHSRAIRNLLRLVAEKNLLLDQKIAVTAQRTTRERLLAYLMTLAKKQGSHTVTVPYDRQGLADYLEVDCSGLSTEIGKLTREGVLSAKKNVFILRDASTLYAR